MHREFEIFRDIFTRFFQPVISAVTSSSAAKRLLFDLGYVPPQQFKVFESLKAKIDAVEGAIATMSELSEEEIEANPQLIITNARNGAHSISALVNDLGNISSVLETELLGSELLHQTDILEALPGKLFNYLTIEYLRQFHYRTYSALNLFGIIEINAIRTVSNPHESPYLEKNFHWDRIGELITSPLQLLKTTLKDSDQYFYGKSLQLIQEMGLSIGLIPHYKFPDLSVLKFISNDPLIEDWPGFKTLEILRIPLIPRDFDSLGIDVYPVVNRVANKIKGLALVLTFDPDKKEFDISDQRKLTLELSGSIANGLGVVIDENDQFRFVTDLFSSPKDLLNNVQFDFRTRITKNDVVEKEDQKLLQIGTTNGNRLEIGSFNLAFGIEKKKNTRIYFETELLQGLIVLKFNEADGFISKLLGEGIESNFDLGIGFSNSNGFYFLGSSMLKIQLPMHLNLGPVEISSLTFSVDIQGKKFLTYVAANIKAILGPIEAVVEDVGMQLDIVFKDGENLGAADLSIGFRPPKGVGLSIDAHMVVGGGFLFFDVEKQEYGGIVQLEIAERIAVKAIGLITTRLPDGSKGFSLLLLISAEGFAPIQLGFGFTLTGVGGLLGVNRSARVDVLRGGIKNGTLNSILFPPDPIRNAAQIVSDLRNVFPPVKDRTLLGPMAVIGWGTPTILTLEIALILEIPEPIRLIVLGRLTAILPEQRAALVRVRMDAIGVIDFNQGEVALDATLYDSRILQFVLTGDMALRANWGAQPTFVLAIGGFNPRFLAPAGFPRLDRLALSLSDGDDLRLRCECYLALTSNTVQFGARLDLHAAGGGFTVDGYLGMDALFHFAPFEFVVDIGAGVALRYHGHLLMGIYLEGTLSGPTPWQVRGKATFKVLFFKVSVSFKHRFGQDEPAPLPQAVDVQALLVAAVSDRRNWSSELTAGEHPLVTLRESSGGTRLRAHPRAELKVRQRVVPLNVKIERYGNAPVSGADRFVLEAVRADGGGGALPLAATRLQDAFALGQYRQMSDDEKLSRPSFESQDAGLRLGTDEVTYEYDRVVDGEIAYETLTMVPGQAPIEEAPTAKRYVMAATVLDAVAVTGAAGQAVIRRTGNARYRTLQQVA